VLYASAVSYLELPLGKAQGMPEGFPVIWANFGPRMR
jgi:hypothetical protein